MADNLPNDPRVHEQKGSKKIFFKNFMDARVDYVIVPVAQHMMRPEQAAKVSGEGYLLGNDHARDGARVRPGVRAHCQRARSPFAKRLGPMFSGLEEAKADVVGMFGLKWLVDHDALPKKNSRSITPPTWAGMFRTVRFGVGEAHGQAEMMEFNYLSRHGAMKREASGDTRWTTQRCRMRSADLAKELLEIEATGDRAARRELVQEVRCDAGGTDAVAESRDKGAGGCGSGVFVSRSKVR